MLRRSALLLTLISSALAEAPNPKADSQTKFIDNGRIKIGVDLSSGGAVCWFSELPADRNLLNRADRGRFIQQSYYGKPDGSLWVDKPWRWNPVQGGDYKGKPARLLECDGDKGTIHTLSVPVNWAGGQDLDDCRMEEWITLTDNVACVRFRFTYRGTDSHPAVHQELPAVFMDFDLTDLVYYKGEKPWTGDALSKDQPGWPNESRKTTENWAGFVGPDGRGVGILFPGTGEITTYRHPGESGPAGGGCSYFAPIRTMAITPGFTFEYRIHLTIGTAEEMRARFQPIAEGLKK